MTLTHTTPKIYRWQINIMERYSTSCHQRNANQNNEYHNISIRMAKIQNTTSNADMDVEQEKTSFIGNYGGHFGNFLQN